MPGGSVFYIPHGCEDAHAGRLAAGLSCMVHGFAAAVCPLCGGRGRGMQTYTEGCGARPWRAEGACNVCQATGLVQGDKPAPLSVINQVLTAAGPCEEPAEPS